MESIVTKNQTAKGKITYDYADLAQIVSYLHERGERFEQETITAGNGYDYIVTIKLDKDGNEVKRLRGSRIESKGLNENNTNMQQQRGAYETYARRYSLLMAYGLATEDDDGQSLSYQQEQKEKKLITAKNYSELSNMLTVEEEDAILRKHGIEALYELPNKSAESYLKQLKERNR